MKKVIVYSQEGCTYCAELKNLLNQNGIEHRIKDIDENKDDWDAISEHSGVDYVPTVLIVDTEDESGKVLAPDRDFDEVSECAQHIMTELYE